MKKYKISVCKGPDCKAGGSDDVHRAFAQALATSELGTRCELGRGGCYGLCHLGPNVIVRERAANAPKDPFSREDFQLMGVPGEIHYGDMAPEKVERIVEEHLKQGAPVEAFRAHDEPVP